MTLQRHLVSHTMPDEVYHADPIPEGSLSVSMAKMLVQPGGPAKLRWQLDTPRQPKATFDFGHAAHLLVLGKGLPIRVIPEDHLAVNGAASTSKAKGFIEAVRAEGGIPLKPEAAAQVVAMADKILANPEAVAVLRAEGVQHEVSAFARDASSGVYLRCRFDSIAPSVVGDYKTALSADPYLFARRTMLSYGYHMQAAHYSDMAVAVRLVDVDTPFRFVVQEKEAPYLVSVVTVGDDYLTLGRREMRKAIELWAECTRTGVWPGYPSITAEPPQWALSDPLTELNPTTEAELMALLNGRNQA